MKMRKECAFCMNINGEIRTTNGQDCVFCLCGKFQYNAPKTETGRDVRSVQTTHAAIKPSQRSRIIDRANSRCERCGKHALASKTGLHVGHILSVKNGHENNVGDELINADENLIAECDECNLGHGNRCLSLRFAVALLFARSAEKHERQDGSANEKTSVADF